MPRANQTAFSLAELLVTLGVLTLTSGVAAPTLQSLIQTNRNQSAHDQLRSSLQMARFYSISQGLEVEICGSLSGTSCDPSWEHGWIVKLRHGELPLYVTRLSQPMRLSWNRPTQAVRFNALGHASSSNGSFLLCSGDSKPQWKIVLNRQGRARTAVPSELLDTDCSNS
jgi:type IV fimbrial biogenesis protein FimT